MIERNATPKKPKATAVVYFSGSMESAKEAAPKDRVRFCNAKYWKGDIESSGTVKRANEPERAVIFSQVFLAPGCMNAESIIAAYAAVGITVETLAPAEAGKPAVKVEAVKTPRELGWKLKSTPAAYLKRSPKGAAAPLARKIIKELGE